MPTGTLPAEGKALWEKVYNDSKAPDCDNACAARKAWGAVKQAGWEKSADGKWHKKAIYAEAYMTISRASYDKTTNRMNWRAVASDTGEDFFKDNMTLELFHDFVNRINSGELPPDKYRSEFWQGGLPYMSLSHYPDLEGKAVPGVIESVYIDGKMLKSKGYFYDNPLGRACFKSVCNDLYGDEPHPEGKVRISIAFLDYKHRHKSNGYVFERGNPDEPLCYECFKEMLSGKSEGVEFLSGHLIHEALTRVPANERTNLEVDKSMAIKTRKDDALSIVGDDEEAKSEVEQIAEVAEELVGRSELVIKSEAEDGEAEAEIVEESQAGVDEEDQEPTEDDESAEEESLVEEATTKKVGGESYPSSDFLVVEDSNSPSTWHLQVKRHGKPDHNLMAAARAALTSNHRGNAYAGPNKEAALKKLKALYKSEGMNWESKSMTQEEWDALVSDVAEIKSLLVKEPEPEHPLDGLWNVFRSSYDEIVQSAGSADEKLRALQEPFSVFSNSMIEQIRSVAQAGNEETPAQAGVSVDEVVGLVMQKIGPQFEEIKSMLRGGTPEQVPQTDIREQIYRRSLLPTSSQPQGNVVQSGQQKSQLRKLVERTT